MKMTNLILFPLILVFFLHFSSWGQEVKPVDVKIDVNKTYQTMHSFGASDAWSCQFVGKNWPEEKKEQIAQWFFSKDFDENGNPKGIGLSMWRFNLGAGSTEQGDSSKISNHWRRAESFFNQDYLGYDWQKQAGQQWFLKKATDYGVENLLLFVNSPPVQYTLNGKAFADKGLMRLNLKPEYIDDFARYMVDVAEHFNANKIPVNYISPVNEPQWGWDGGDQEGSPATNKEVLEVTRALSSKLADSRLDCKVSLAESGVLMFISDFKVETRVYGPFANKYKPYADQINYFFEPSSKGYVGNLPNVENAVAGHSYFSTWPVRKLVNKRKNVLNTINKANPTTAYWQSEFCILEDNKDIVRGGTRDLGMPTALYVARVIYHDLVTANAASWQWWTAISPVDYKDGLVYLDADGAFDNEKLKTDGTIHDSKLMWSLGNYSRFIRPGMQRVDVEYLQRESKKTRAYNVMVSAFKDDKIVVVVAVNYSNEVKPLNINLANGENKSQVTTYVTSDDKNLEKVVMDFNKIGLSPRSVTTIILE